MVDHLTTQYWNDVTNIWDLRTEKGILCRSVEKVQTYSLATDGSNSYQMLWLTRKNLREFVLLHTHD